jgi:hypothetical protein
MPIVHLLFSQMKIVHMIKACDHFKTSSVQARTKNTIRQCSRSRYSFRSTLSSQALTLIPYRILYTDVLLKTPSLGNSSLHNNWSGIVVQVLAFVCSSLW